MADRITGISIDSNEIMFSAEKVVHTQTISTTEGNCSKKVATKDQKKDHRRIIISSAVVHWSLHLLKSPKNLLFP